MRILLSAFYLSPYRGSEAGVGWKMATELAKEHDITVLCGGFGSECITKSDLQRYKEEGNNLPDNLTVKFVQASALACAINRVHAAPGLWFLYYRAYNLWQQQALRIANQLHAKTPFDLVHHVNVVGYREPGYLWKLGIPWFWGPIDGAAMIPLPFLLHMDLNSMFGQGIRNAMNWLQMRCSMRCRTAARHAHKIWTVTPQDYRMVTELWNCQRAEQMLETGGGVSPGIKPKGRMATDPLNLVWSGQFVGRKAMDLLIFALKKLQKQYQGSYRLHVLGDGPLKDIWKEMAIDADISNHIIWHGMLSRDEALKVMSRADVLVHTSLKEATATVLFEALSLGLPVICHDACGMGTAIDNTCGIKVPLHNPKTSIAGFASAIARLLNNPDLFGRLSAGAIKRADELSWERKIARISAAYRGAIGNETR